MAGRNPFAPPGGVPFTGIPAGGLSGAPITGGAPPGGLLPGAGRQIVPAGAAPLPTRPTPGGPRLPRHSRSDGTYTPPGPLDQVHANLDMAEAQHKQNMQAFDVLDKVRGELDDLMNLGDMVRPEDVIQSAGRLVGHGFGAENLAQLLSDMPTMGGQGLASWIRMHDITVTQAEMQLRQASYVTQSRMGIAAIKSLAASQLEHAAGQDKGGEPSAPPITSIQNPLGPGPGGQTMGGQGIMAPQPVSGDSAGNGNGSSDEGGTGG